MKDPPEGTYARIRTRSIWAVAFFASSAPPAFIGAGAIAADAKEAGFALPLAFLLWSVGFLFAIAAAFPTLRYWEELPLALRWLGALPLLTVSLFLTIAILATLP